MERTAAPVPDTSPDDHRAIEHLTRAFFAAFTNTRGRRPDVRSLRDLFLPAGVVVKATDAEPEVYSIDEFITPRERLLTDGTLADFEEAELSGRTDLFGNIAQRVCRYRKSGTLAGRPFEATGVKVLQFVRTAAGWRLSAVAWDDEREGFAVPERV